MIVVTMVVRPAVPEETVVERVVLGGADVVALEESLGEEEESEVAEAEFEAAVEEGDELPLALPLALPVMEARFGALEPVFPPAVPYALGS